MQLVRHQLNMNLTDNFYNAITDGVDFSPPSDSLLTLNTMSPNKNITIRINNDNVVEPTESFMVNLSFYGEPGPKVILKQPSIAKVIIMDDDGKKLLMIDLLTSQLGTQLYCIYCVGMDIAVICKTIVWLLFYCCFCYLALVTVASQTAALIGGILGALSFLLILGIVLTVIIICCYIRRLSQEKENAHK